MYRNSSVKCSTWQGCYNDSWKGIIIEEAFSHPAKYSKSLIFKIIKYLIDKGYIKKGDTVLDCFAGVGLGALPAMAYGLHYIGVELEPRFVALGQQNLTYWRQRFGFTGAVLVQGDSCHLRQVLTAAGGVGEAGAIIGSPPYVECLQNGHSGIDKTKGKDPRDPQSQGVRRLEELAAGYGTTPGQLGALPPGRVDSIVSSPPHLHGLGKEHTYADDAKRDKDGHRRIMAEKGIVDPFYGRSPGQLGNLPAGEVEAVVASPPYADGCAHTGGRDPDPAHIQGGPLRMVEYGMTPGQLGGMTTGDVADCLVSSPPYAQSVHEGNGIDASKLMGNPAGVHSQAHAEGYGTTPGQLGALREGSVDGVVSSPPFLTGDSAGPESLGKRSDAAAQRMNQIQRWGVGGQISQGNLATETPSTFWAAASQVVAECVALLRPGGLAVWVVKDFLRNGQRVTFSAQWRQLCEHHGLQLCEWIQVSLQEDHGTQETLFGPAEQQITERLSFFRRLAHKRYAANDPRRILHEDILIFRKEPP